MLLKLYKCIFQVFTIYNMNYSVILVDHIINWCLHLGIKTEFWIFINQHCITQLFDFSIQILYLNIDKISSFYELFQPILHSPINITQIFGYLFQSLSWFFFIGTKHTGI